MLPEELPI